MFRISYVFISTVLCLILLTLTSESKAQRDTIYTDTLKIEDAKLPKHSPTKASLYSMVVPGLGQVYNKKYWKVPIIWAGMGTFIYFAVQENKLFSEKYDAYKNRLSGDSTDVFLVEGNFYSNEALLSSMDINRRNRDLMFIVAGGIYILQIVDASVDAHLFYFNVSDDLSLNYMPYVNFDPRTGRTQQGLTLNLSF